MKKKVTMKMFAAMAAMLPFVSAFGSSAPAHGDGKMVWGFMMQLGHNMWGEEPLVGEPKTGTSGVGTSGTSGVGPLEMCNF